MLNFIDSLSKELDELPVEKDLNAWREEVLLAIKTDDAERLRVACSNKESDINGRLFLPPTLKQTNFVRFCRLVDQKFLFSLGPEKLAEMGYGFESNDTAKSSVLGEFQFRRSDTALHVRVNPSSRARAHCSFSNFNLQVAVRNKALKCCRILLKLGANRGKANGDGKTPGQLAASQETDELRELFSHPLPAAPRILEAIAGYGAATLYFRCDTAFDPAVGINHAADAPICYFKVFAIPQGIRRVSWFIRFSSSNRDLFDSHRRSRSGCFVQSWRSKQLHRADTN